MVIHPQPMALALFAAGILLTSVARPDQLYHLNVYCDDSHVATATFGHTVTTHDAGSIFLCAGVCGGRLPITDIKDVLAALPAEVSAGLTAELQAHQASAELYECARSVPGSSAAADACKQNPSLPRGIFLLSRSEGVTRIHAEPRRESKRMSGPNGALGVLREVRQVDGKIWFYVRMAGLPSGWVEASDTTCIRPRESRPPPIRRDPDFRGANPSAALVAGARG
jgi:hypothetical protein